jgi:arylsulfatase A-like enzyme
MVATFIFITGLTGYSQQIQRPKLVVGIIVDQMRWDFLYRFYPRYAANGGFKRLMSKGFNCDNTLVPYTPTYTACGHAGIYTGSIPAIHGITGNDWYDNDKQQYVYCTEDAGVSTVGSSNVNAGKMSPVNMYTTTICDELKLATNFKSKVVGVALKDRGGILPAGHTANAAYWYDPASGDWITSTYYMTALPAWVTEFNKKKLVDQYYAKGWSTLYPLETYVQSTADENNYEVRTLGRGFPYNLSSLAGKNYNLVMGTPYGNSLTTQFSKVVLEQEQLGSDSVTDFLAISYSSPDYIGHSFGANSVEIEDTYLRLDQELAELLDYLDTKVGQGQYLLFLSSDHGAAHNPRFLKDHKIPAGNVDISKVADALNLELKGRFGTADLVTGIVNFQVILNLPVIEASSRLKKAEIVSWIIQYLGKQEGVMQAVSMEDLETTVINSTVKKMFSNGYYKKRSGQVQILYKPQWLEGFENGGTSHGLWNPYDAHIPLIWYGWNIPQGSASREIYMTDIAPTLAALLKIQAPNGNIGKPITEIIK